MVYGDLRDLFRETVIEDDTDEFIVLLSAVGVITTEKLKELGIDEADGFLMKAVEATSSGDSSTALLHYGSAVAAAPARAEIHAGYALALLENSRPVDALAAAEKATNLAPEDSRSNYALGHILRLGGKRKAALAALGIAQLFGRHKGSGVHRCDAQLGHTLTGLNGVGFPAQIDHGHLQLAAVIAVHHTHAVGHAQAVLDGKAAAGVHQCHAVGAGQLDGKAYVEQYVQTLTHEMKSPLAAINASAELLCAPMPEADRARFAASIGEQGARLAQMIDRLLALATLEQHRSLPERKPVDLTQLVRQQVAAS